MEHFVVYAFQIDLVLNDDLEQLKLLVEASVLGDVSVLEVIGLQVETRSTRHQISNHLH